PRRGQGHRRHDPARRHLGQLFPAEQARIVKLLIEKVIVSPDDLEVRLRANGIERLVLELQPAGAAQPEEAFA
ncbi:MAG: hypothetical protein ABI696_13780, partial [Rubrivivax sp.]